MSDQKLNQIETMLSDLIRTVGTMKAFMEEEREYNQQQFEKIDKRFEKIDQRFEKIDQRFEEMDQRFDEVMAELKDNKIEHQYMAKRIFQNEMEIDKLKEAYFQR